jgi:hypothetical protein
MAASHFTTVFNRSVKKIFNLHKKFPEQTIFLNNIITFSRSSKRP